MADFRSLLVWQKRIVLVKEVYLCTRALPKEELFGLTSQMRRCAVSIPSNIAEGSKRGTKKDFIQLLRIASGSAAELETQLLIVSDLYTVNTDTAHGLLKEVQKMLQSLIKRL